MLSPIWLTFISIFISFLALVVSAITLWKNYFGKFKPITTTGRLGFRIYPIKSGSDKWYIPSYDISVSITNKGVLPGKVFGMRMVVHYPTLPIPGNKEIFTPKWEVNYTEFKQNSKERFLWINKAVINDWMPYVILPKCTVTKHIIFESRWDDAVIQELQIALEVYTDTDKKWNEIARWNDYLTPSTWSELADVGSSFSIRAKNSMEEDTLLIPPDLHKYTGTKKILPTRGFYSESSYLAYPDIEEEVDESLS